MTSTSLMWPQHLLLEISWPAGWGPLSGSEQVERPRARGLPAAWFIFLTPSSRAVTRCLLSEVIGN